MTIITAAPSNRNPRPYTVLGWHRATIRGRVRDQVLALNLQTHEIIPIRMGGTMRAIKLSLMALAPLDYWDRAYPGRGGAPEWCRAYSDLIWAGYAAGQIIEPPCSRGRLRLSARMRSPAFLPAPIRQQARGYPL